jgi:diacylglycerol kinase family enzyme
VGEHEFQPLDAMQVKDRYFLLYVSAGISAQAMRKTPVERKRRFGILAYVWTILKQLFGFQSRRFHLSIDGQEQVIRATEVLVSNGSIFSRPLAFFGSQEDFSDSQFEVQIITARTLKDYLTLLVEVILYRGRKEEQLKQLWVKDKIIIASASRPCSVQADGEPIGYTPVEVHIVPGAVNVIVPRINSA